jgi:YceI-like domain
VESDRCPTATFILTAPLALRSGVADGERVTASATGDLTIHGVTNRVTIELEAELKGDSAVVVASAPVALADYDIEAIHRRCQGDNFAVAIGTGSRPDLTRRSRAVGIRPGGRIRSPDLRSRRVGARRRRGLATAGLGALIGVTRIVGRHERASALTVDEDPTVVGLASVARWTQPVEVVELGLVDLDPWGAVAHVRDSSTRAANSVLAATVHRSISSYVSQISGASDNGTSSGTSRPRWERSTFGQVR